MHGRAIILRDENYYADDGNSAHGEIIINAHHNIRECKMCSVRTSACTAVLTQSGKQTNPDLCQPFYFIFFFFLSYRSIGIFMYNMRRPWEYRGF